MRIVPEPWENRYARLLRDKGWTCHEPGTGCLFSQHTYAGKQDTSYAASVYMAPRVGTVRQQVLDDLKRHGPATDPEIQARMRMEPNTERPRRVELVEGGFVRDSGQRKRHHGKEHIIWEATS
jgi:hypothetical protein